MTAKYPLINLIYENADSLLGDVVELIKNGADVNEETKYSETPIRVASNLGRFDVVKYLLDYGVDAENLKWTKLFHAVACGSIVDVQKRLNFGDSLEDRDTWSRTPFLLAVQTGEIEKVKILLEAGANRSDKGRGDKRPLEYALQSDDHLMLEWLISQGFNSEEYNSFGYTPLIQACEYNSVNCVKTLIEVGVDIFKKDRSQFSRKTAIGHIRDFEIAKLLISKGADINELDGTNKVRLELLGLHKNDSIKLSKEEYLEGRYREFGKKNPELCHSKYCYEMVRNSKAASYAKSHFKDSTKDGQPVWCYERYGKTITDLGDNEYIEIGGEHEDSYDPDFCIYNEVFHHKGGGDFDIYMYPREVFPPTDNHSATKIEDSVYIIGNLGYGGTREFDLTPVYRLNIKDFSIEEVVTNGDNPGWIYNHIAVLESDEAICIKGGMIARNQDDQELHENNKYDYRLNTQTLIWTRHDPVSLTKESDFFPEEEKQFEQSDRTLVSYECEGNWYALKLLDVHRIDVYKGQSIIYDNQKIEMLVDDFVFIPVYIKSHSFESLKSLEEAVRGEKVIFEQDSLHCRAVNFPSNCRYLGFQDITKEERSLLKDWKIKFGEKEIIKI